jgi:hypothetical protein
MNTEHWQNKAESIIISLSTFRPKATMFPSLSKKDGKGAIEL